MARFDGRRMTATTTLTTAEVGMFWRDGFVRVAGAFSTADAAAMRDVVWHALERRGFDRHDPLTWRQRDSAHLQHLRGHRAFARIGTARTLGAIADLAPRWAAGPKDWGAFFLLFPSGRPWTVPWQAWHVDHPWTAPVQPLDGLKVHSIFGVVEPGAGGMTVVAGSHLLVEAALQADPPPAGERAAKTRARVMRSCAYPRAMGTDGRGDPAAEAARIARFVDAEEDVLGCRLQVRELTADAGDVFLIHPLLLHTRPTNAGRRPRFLLNKDLGLG
jgi:hypothetical protein